MCKMSVQMGVQGAGEGLSVQKECAKRVCKEMRNECANGRARSVGGAECAKRVCKWACKERGRG